MLKLFFLILCFILEIHSFDVDKIINAIINQDDFNIISDELVSGSLIYGHLNISEIEFLLDEIGKKLGKLKHERKYIGQTLHNEPIYLYETTSFNEQIKDSILLTSLIHSNEFVSVQMSLFIYLKTLYQFYADAHYTKFFMDTQKLCILPIVNKDGLRLIEKFEKELNKTFLIRKNLHESKQQKCVGEFTGVDLDRNFKYIWDGHRTQTTFDPCHENYNGESAFSEPETLAISTYLEGEQVGIALNFQAQSISKSGGDFYLIPELEQNKSSIALIYDEFLRDAPLKLGQKTGQALELLKEKIHGDASTWMVREKDILSFTLMLGKNDQLTPSETKDVFIQNEKLLQFILHYATFQPRFLNLRVQRGKHKEQFLTTIYQQKITNMTKEELKYSNSLILSLQNQGLGSFVQDSLEFELLYKEEVNITEIFFQKVEEEKLLEKDEPLEKAILSYIPDQYENLKIIHQNQLSVKFILPKINKREYFNFYINCNPNISLENVNLFYKIKYENNMIFSNVSNDVNIILLAKENQEIKKFRNSTQQYREILIFLQDKIALLIEIFLVLILSVALYYYCNRRSTLIEESDRKKLFKNNINKIFKSEDEF